jgi:hypothetical protein
MEHIPLFPLAMVGGVLVLIGCSVLMVGWLVFGLWAFSPGRAERSENQASG